MEPPFNNQSKTPNQQLFHRFARLAHRFCKLRQRHLALDGNFGAGYPNQMLNLPETR
jgi:hypothetical protein